MSFHKKVTKNENSSARNISFANDDIGTHQIDNKFNNTNLFNWNSMTPQSQSSQRTKNYNDDFKMHKFENSFNRTEDRNITLLPPFNNEISNSARSQTNYKALPKEVKLGDNSSQFFDLVSENEEMILSANKKKSTVKPKTNKQSMNDSFMTSDTDANAEISTTLPYPSKKILDHLQQIRDCKKQALEMISSINQMDENDADNCEKLMSLVQRLDDEEGEYLSLLQDILAYKDMNAPSSTFDSDCPENNGFKSNINPKLNNMTNSLQNKYDSLSEQIIMLQDKISGLQNEEANIQLQNKDQQIIWKSVDKAFINNNYQNSKAVNGYELSDTSIEDYEKWIKDSKNIQRNFSKLQQKGIITKTRSKPRRSNIDTDDDSSTVAGSDISMLLDIDRRRLQRTLHDLGQKKMALDNILNEIHNLKKPAQLNNEVISSNIGCKSLNSADKMAKEATDLLNVIEARKMKRRNELSNENYNLNSPKLLNSQFFENNVDVKDNTKRKNFSQENQGETFRNKASTDSNYIKQNLDALKIDKMRKLVAAKDKLSKLQNLAQKMQSSAEQASVTNDDSSSLASYFLDEQYKRHANGEINSQSERVNGTIADERKILHEMQNEIEKMEKLMLNNKDIQKKKPEVKTVKTNNIVEDVIPNEVLYNEMRQRRILEEERRERQRTVEIMPRQDVIHDENGGGDRSRNRALWRGHTSYPNRFDQNRSPSEIMTMATWGGSTSANIENVDENDEVSEDATSINNDEDDEDDVDTQNQKNEEVDDDDENDQEHENSEILEGFQSGGAHVVRNLVKPLNWKNDVENNQILFNNSSSPSNKNMYEKHTNFKPKQNNETVNFNIENGTIGNLQNDVQNLQKQVASLVNIMKKTKQHSAEENLKSLIAQNQMQQNQLFLDLNQSFFRLASSQNSLMERINKFEHHLVDNELINPDFVKQEIGKVSPSLTPTYVQNSFGNEIESNVITPAFQILNINEKVDNNSRTYVGDYINSGNGSENEVIKSNDEAIFKHQNSAQNQFEDVRQTIYSEAAKLISQNEKCPRYLLALFSQLQMLSTDFMRQRALQVVRQIVEREPATNNSLSNQSGQESMDDFMKAVNNPRPSVDMSSSIFSTPSPSNAPANDNPFAMEALGDTVIKLDKAMKVIREHDNESSIKKALNKEEMSNCNKNENARNSRKDSPRSPIDAQLLDTQVQDIMLDCIASLETNMSATITSHFIADTSRNILSFVKNIASKRSDFDQYIYRQLCDLVTNLLMKYKGKKISEVFNDLIMELSDILFNELAFLKIMQNMDQTRENYRGKLSQYIKKSPRKKYSGPDPPTNLGVSSSETTDREGLTDANQSEMESEVGEGETTADDEATETEDDTNAPKNTYSSSKLKNARLENLNKLVYYDESFSVDEDLKPENERTLQINLAQSEVRPCTRIGSDEDEDEADQSICTNEVYETAVSRDAKHEGHASRELRDGDEDSCIIGHTNHVDITNDDKENDGAENHILLNNND